MRLGVLSYPGDIWGCREYSSIAEGGRWRSSIWAVVGRESVRHADSDAGWRSEHRDSGPNLDPKTQTHVEVRVRE